MTVDAEVVEYLPAVREVAPVTLFRTDDPSEVVKRASATADELAKVIRQKKLTVNISGREHVKVDGWCLLGTMLGVFPVCVWTREMEHGWEARVEARTRSGEVVGAAEAQCLRHETNWRSRDDFALRSMAQTRATSKALRLPLGFVMTLAGYDATPAEEMVADSHVASKTRVTAKHVPKPPADDPNEDNSALHEPRPRNQSDASEKQVGMIGALLAKLDPEERELEVARIQDAYGVGKAEELLKKDASAVISRLKGEETAG